MSEYTRQDVDRAYDAGLKAGFERCLDLVRAYKMEYEESDGSGSSNSASYIEYRDRILAELFHILKALEKELPRDQIASPKAIVNEIQMYPPLKENG
jgi:hypothetical protein